MITVFNHKPASVTEIDKYIEKSLITLGYEEIPWKRIPWSGKEISDVNKLKMNDYLDKWRISQGTQLLDKRVITKIQT